MTRLTGKVNFFRPASIKAKTQTLLSKIVKFIEGKPLTIFIMVLVILLGLIAGGNALRKPEEEKKVEPGPIQVETFTIGTAPRITYQAKVEKAGVVQIASATGGIVSKINVHEGDRVKRGQTLVNLSNNYLGGNVLTVQRQIAAKEHLHVLDTFNLQKDSIARQREIAEKTQDNAQELRKIADDSLSDTKSLISLNDEILFDLDETIAELETNNAGGVNDDLITQTKQLKSQFLAGNNQARSSLRSLELNSGKDKPPSNLATLQKELTLKQLELEEKSLELSRETSSLQLRLAQVNESIMFPASPFEGTIERVHVKVGDLVQPGTVLITLSSSNKAITAIAYVPQKTAQRISLVEDSKLYIDDQIFESTPTFISSEATNGQLYSVIFTIPIEFSSNLTNESYIEIEMPIGVADTSSAVPFIPIDAIFQTQDETFVFVAESDKAASRKVTLGTVTGSFVEITEGLSTSDQVILNRNVVDGDKIEVIQYDQPL